MVPRKLVETLFRRWPILVALVAGLTAAGWYLSDAPLRYQSSARVWVSELLQTQANNGLPAQTPAARQVEVFNDLLATDAFRRDVAVAAGLVPAEATVAAQASGAWEVGRALSVTAAGPNLLSLSARTADAASAQRIVQGAIEQYQARMKRDGERETGILIDSIRKQLTVAQGELAKAQAELSAYLKVNPLAADRANADAEYLRLQGNLDSQVKIVDRLNASLQDAQLTAVSGGNELLTLTVQDAASLPAAPMPVSLASKAAYPAAGFAMGLMLAATYLYLSYRADHTVRSSDDLLGLAVPLLGCVPELKRERKGLRRPWPRRGEYARGLATSLARAPEAPGGQR